MSDNFKDYALWQQCAMARGYHGPYQMAGQPKLQFCYPQGGTAALWNAVTQVGVVFPQRLQ